MGKILYYNEKANQAIETLTNVLQTTTRLAPEGHWLRGEAHTFLALSFSAIGAETEALEHRAQALQLYEDIFGEQSV